MSCNECHQRAVAGPHYNPARRTGRTGNAVKQSVLAAAFGKRVVYICGNQAGADYARTIAKQFIAEAFGELANVHGLLYNRVSVQRDRILFYFANGEVSGQIVFRSMSAQDINMGMREPERFHVIEDHHTVELREERRKEEARREAARQIVALMREHGFVAAHQLNRKTTQSNTISFD